MANRAGKANYKNHVKQKKINYAKSKYNWGMMIINANAKKLRNGEIDISNNENEGEKN